MSAPPAGPSGAPTVVFVGGYGRSGSTLLDRLLGQLDSFVSLGEFYWLWRWSFGQNQRCGCGEAFRECSFWRAVFDRGFGGFAGVDVDRALALQAACEGRRYGAQALLGAHAGALAEYRALLGRVYRAVLDVSGARVLVDSSKFPARGLVLGRLDGLETRVVHIVRDSRAVAFSWLRRRPRPEIAGARELMPRRSPVRTALAWVTANVEMEAIARRSGTPQRQRYEDLASDPAPALRRLAAGLGVASPDLGFLHDGRAELGVAHTVAGNPMRFRAGTIELSPDDEWTSAMRPHDRLAVTALTLPLLARYGYLGRRQAPAAGTERS